MAYRKGTRALSGKPGKNYWQNKGDYNIHVTFDPSSNLLTGNEIITYYNNSPDTLKNYIIRLYPDLYKKGVPRLSTIKEKDLSNGVTIDSFRIGNEIISNFTDSQKAFQRTPILLSNQRIYFAAFKNPTFYWMALSGKYRITCTYRHG